MIEFGSPDQDRAARRLAEPRRQRIRLSHRAQIAHQMQGIPVTDGFRKAVGHGKRKAGTLQQTAQIADFPHRQHTGRQAARYFYLCLGKAGAQLGQGLTAKHQAQKKPIRAQGAPTLHQLSDRVVGPVQGKRVNDKIMRARFQREDVVITNRRAQIAPQVRETCHDGWRCKRSVNLDQSFLNLGARFVMQKERARSGAIAQQRVAIGQGRGRLHGAKHGGMTGGMQGALLHMIYPPQCVACDAMVASDFGLCGACWRQTPFVTGLVCDLCGTPLPGQDPGHAVHCDDCLTIARPWSRGRAAMLYRDKARDMVLQLKHADRQDLARPAGAWLLRAAQPILEPGMLVAPIPLHWLRLLRRRYNQSALLSAQLARLAGLDHSPDLLQRVRNTQSQEGRDRDGRFVNMADSLRVHPRRRALLDGRHILLVDDVMTSGATLAAAAEACIAQGARAISTLVLCRVAKEG